MAVFLWFSGYVPKSDYFIIMSMIFFILSLAVILLNISLRHQRNEAQSNAASSKKAVSSMWTFIGDLSEYPYNDGRTFEREKKSGLRAAIAKNGKIPRDSNAIITKLNEKDTYLGKRFADLERELREKGLID